MTRRFLISSLAVGLLALGGLTAQASNVPLPANLAALEGNSAIVGNLEFSNFGYSTADRSGGPAPPPPASGVNVDVLTGVAGETGLSFSGSFLRTGE